MKSSFRMPTLLPATKGLCLALLVVSLVGSITQRTLGFGIQHLTYNAGAILKLQVWRLLTYPFVESGTFSLLLSLLVLWFLGSFLESLWGTRYFLQFFILSAVGAGILAIPLSFLINHTVLFSDMTVAQGPDPAIDAMLVSLAITSPQAKMLFGFILPISARTLIYIILGIELVSSIQSGVSNLSVTLAGMLMGYLLTTGYWKPSRLWLKIRSVRTPKRPRLYVVLPQDKDGTLH